MTTKQDTFEGFLLRLEPDIESSTERYLRLRAKLIKFFEWRRGQDSESLADETISRLVENLYAGEHIDQPSAYVYAIARNVYREFVRKAARFADVSSDLEFSIDESDLFVECARRCFEKLSHDKRGLLEQYYSDWQDREEMAKRSELSLAALRTKIHRLKAELRECYKNCIRGSTLE